MRIFIDGEAGTTGLTLRKRLSARDDVTLLHASDDARKDLGARLELYAQADIAFMCLPDDAAREAAQALGNGGPKLLDTSTVHRTAEGWAYGFAELSAAHRERVQTSRHVAVPGCYASGFIALCYPLIACGLLPADYPACAHAVSGYTGGGRRMMEQYAQSERPDALNAPRAYALGQAHKHLPEIQRVCGLSSAPYLFPSVADYPRGMMVTLPIVPEITRAKISVDILREAYRAHYENALTVRVMGSDETPADGFLPANLMAGRDSMHIYVLGSDRRPAAVAVFDNLGKGACGAAIQCLNLMTGADEACGLQL